MPTASTTPVSGDLVRRAEEHRHVSQSQHPAAGGDDADQRPRKSRRSIAELQAAQQGQAAAGRRRQAPTDPALLRKLAATHAADALKEIESEN